MTIFDQYKEFIKEYEQLCKKHGMYITYYAYVDSDGAPDGDGLDIDLYGSDEELSDYIENLKISVGVEI